MHLRNIIAWLYEHVGENILVDKLTNTEIGTVICGVEALSSHLDRERKSNRWKKLTAEQKIQESQNVISVLRLEKDQIGAELSNTENMLQRKSRQLEETVRQWDETEQRLTQVQHQFQQMLQKYEQTRRRLERECEQIRQQLRQARENAPIVRQLKNRGAQLRSRREQGENPVKWGVKYLVCLLCWVPEKCFPL